MVSLNFTATFDGILPAEGLSAHGGAQGRVDSVSAHAPPGAIIVPDAQLLFTGDFKRSGVDLILAKDDRELVLQDYFKGEKRVALASPDGAHLTGDIVNALAGHVQLAQADGSASGATVIGHVTKLVGTATALRNGVSIILNQGDNVNKGDVVQSGSDSTLGITFIDGTVFGLASNAKMVLNEMVYDPNGSSNSSLLSLVQGTISFVAGATAKHGDMKVDTPVATMGIRGTAVLVEIDFQVPGQGSAPPAKFQVLVEPDGTTGSYILFDKTTLTPMATVNQAGTQTIISGQGAVSFLSSAQLSVDAQNLINQLFAWKFTNADPNPKSNTHFTDTVIPETNLGFKLADGTIINATPQLVYIPTATAVSGGTDPRALDHIPGPPTVVTFNGGFIERTSLTRSSTIDTVSGKINFADINAGDLPTVSAKFDKFAYKDANNNDVSATLTAEQLAAVKAVEVPLQVVQDPGNKNTGSATWTYSIADSAFDFLAVGETLTLTYMARVDNNFALNNEFTLLPFTITITGTNDAPTVATAGGTIIERAGTGNTVSDTISGTVTFTDADLTDRPVVSAALSSSEPFKYLDAQGNDITATLTPAQLAAIKAVEVPLSVVQAAGNSHNGSASWTYTAPDNAFDFIAEDETLVLNYVIQVDDGHGGVVSTPISLSITTVSGTNDVPTIVAALTTATGALTEDAASLAASGTITFQDLDLTDTHTASFVLKSSDADANLPGYAETTPLSQIGSFALTAVNETPGGTGIGSVGWSFTLADNDPVLQSLALDQIITQVYTVTFDDHHGGTVSQDVTVTITGTNDAPEITSGRQTGSITEIACITDSSTPDIACGTLTFTDTDLIDTHKMSITNVSASGETAGLPADSAVLAGWLSLGTLSDSSGGTVGSIDWSFSAQDKVFDYLGVNQIVTLTYTVEVDDHHGGSVTENIVVTVTGTNDKPIAMPDIGHVIEAGNDASGNVLPGIDTASGNVVLNDIDPDLTHQHVVVGVVAGTESGVLSGCVGTTVEGTYGSLVLNADGTWTYTLDNDRPATDALAQGPHASDVFSYTESDLDGGTSATTLTIDIAGTDDAPSATVTLASAGINDAPVLIFSTGGDDTLTGGPGPDDFVFAQNVGHDVVTDFTPGQDHIDLSAIVTTDDVAGWMSQHVAASPTNPADTLITIDAADTIVLHGVSTASLTANDFILHLGS